MKRGIDDLGENNLFAQTPSNQNLFSRIAKALKYAFSWIFGTQNHLRDSSGVDNNEIEINCRKKVQRDDGVIKSSGLENSILVQQVSANAAMSPILLLPLDVLKIIMAHASSQERAFQPNTNAVCRQFQKATDEYRLIQYNKKNEPNPPPVGGYERNPALEKQEKEINYLLENEAALLSITNNLPIMKDCLERLKKSAVIPASTRRFFICEQILNTLNTVIIETRIQISQSSVNPQTLNCENCHLTRLPEKVLKDPQHKNYWGKLQRFHLYDNQLRCLPPKIGQLVALKELYIDNNQLRSLPPEIGQLSKLRLFSLNNNQLQSLPSEIGQLVKLERLDLDNNQLQSLPSEIGRLVELYYLHLANNQLQSLPPEIGQLTKLSLLDVANNQLQSLPFEIGQLVNLLLLMLENNQLQSLPSEIGEMAALKKLMLVNNRLQNFPDNLRENVLFKFQRGFDPLPLTKTQVLSSQRKPSSSHEDEAKKTLRL